MSAPHAAHQHHPIRVVHDLDLDDQGRPAKWLWHLECRTCGLPLDHGLTAAAGDQLAEAFAAVAS